MMTQTTDQTQIQQLALPSVDATQLVATPQLQQAIAAQADATNTSPDTVEAYYVTNITRLFATQDATVAQFVAVFESIINVDHAKETAKKIIDQYADLQNDPVIAEAVRTLDTELNDLGPVVAKLKEVIEGNVSAFAKIRQFFRNPFRAKDNIVTTSLQGLKSRITSIDTAFDRYEEQLLVNQEVASEQIPTIGREIYQIDGMREVLSTVREQVSDDGTKAFLDSMINQLTLINGIKKESLQRLIIAARMNGNSRLLLKATEFKVFGLLPSLLSLNFILSSQAKVNDISQAADEFVEKLRGNAKTTLEANMNAEKQAKETLREQLEITATNISDLNDRVAEHKQTMAQAQQAITDYLPTYEKNVAELEKSITDMQLSESDFMTVSDALLDKVAANRAILQASISPAEDTQPAQTA